MAPISIRDPSEKGAMGNRVSAMMVPIPTDVADPLERLRIVHVATQESKEAAGAIPARTLSDMNQFIPFALAGVAARNAATLRLADTNAPTVNTVVTNVPGPQQPLYLVGAKLLEQVGLGPVTDGVGLFHPVFSYNGRISVGVTACREMMPDPGVLRGVPAVLVRRARHGACCCDHLAPHPHGRTVFFRGATQVCVVAKCARGYN